MILGETETENVPLLGDDGAEGEEFTGDAEEGSFLGSKNKVIHTSYLINPLFQCMYAINTSS